MRMLIAYVSYMIIAVALGAIIARGAIAQTWVVAPQMGPHQTVVTPDGRHVTVIRPTQPYGYGYGYNQNAWPCLSCSYADGWLLGSMIRQSLGGSKPAR